MTRGSLKQDYPLQIPVSEAIRKHDGRYRVFGMITSMSQIYNMIESITFYCDKCKKACDTILEKPEFSVTGEDIICPKCNQLCKNPLFSYVSVITIELQDTDTFNDIERLPVLLFGKDTENINVGEHVLIDGQIFVLHPNGTNKGKLFTYFYADSIKYENRENIVLNSQDVKTIKKFRDKIGTANIIPKLVEMFDQSIIGYESVKEGILLSAVNTGINNKNCNKGCSNGLNQIKRGTRERINILLIGEPGLAKSQLLYSSTTLVQNSRFESAENSSGKSLTAIVSKEADMPILRLGPIPQSKYAFCGLNEIGKLSFEEQGHLLSILEEGMFTINKYGIGATIQSPTTIIASANPISTEWKDIDKISHHEIPILGPLKDRFDLIFVFRRTRDKQRIREYAIKKSEQEGKLLPSYRPFLIRYIEYAKQFNPKFTSEANIMLNNYFVELNGKGFGSNRILDTLRRLAKARTRLKLKEWIDAEDARETMQFYNVILQQYQQVVAITSNPRDVAYNCCISILKESKIGMTVEALFEKACGNDKQISEYILSSSKSFMLKDNKKVRAVYDLLLNHPSVKRIQEKPVVLQWFDDNDKTEAGNNDNKSYDLYDLYDLETNTKTKTISTRDIPFPQTTEIRDTNQWSYGSYRSDSNNKQLLYCNYCDNYASYDEQEIVKHSINKHPRKVALPTRQMLEHEGLSLKGNPWE